MKTDIDLFIEFLLRERNSSDSTATAYRTDLQQFLAFLRCRESALATTFSSWAEVSAVVVQRYVDELQKREYASATVVRKLVSIKSFFNFLQRNHLVSCNPIRDFRSPPVERALPQPLSELEITRILTALEREATPKAVRDQALLETLYATGMRVSELVKLNLTDVDLESGTVTCGGAGRTRRTLPLYERTVSALRRYSVDSRPLLKAANEEDETALFLNHRGGRLTRQGLWLIIRDSVNAVGITTPVTPHTLRHSFAFHLLNSGVDIKEAQQRLGHASASTTQVYCKSNACDSRKQVPDELRTRASAVVIDGKLQTQSASLLSR